MNKISLREFCLVQDVYLHTRVAQDELHCLLLWWG